MRPTSGAARARRATVPLGHTRSWWRQRRSGSSRRPLCHWTWPNSTSMSGTITLGKKIGKPVFQRASWLVGALHSKASVSLKPTSAPPFLSGPLGPFFQVAVEPPPLPNSCWQLSWKQWLYTPPTLQVVDDISGHVAGTSKMVQVLTAEAARLLVEGLQARDLPLSKGKSKVLIDGTDELEQALLQLGALGIDECDTARNMGADLQLGRRRRALVVKERLARGSEAHETRQTAAEGVGTHSQSSDPHWARMRGVLLGVLRFWASLQHSSKSSESMPKPHVGSSLGQNAATTMMTHAPGSWCKKVDPALSTSPTSHISWQLRRRRWAFGRTRLPFCGPTALRT